MQTLRTWICKIVPVLEKAFPGLPNGPVVWRVHFTGDIGDRPGERDHEFLNFDQAKAGITIAPTGPAGTVKLVADSEFEKAFHHPENIAERALVWRTVEGFTALAGKKLFEGEHASLVNGIVGDANARQAHAFSARKFRDFVRRSIWRHPIIINTDDLALLKLGLGWRVRDHALGGDIAGKEECTSY